MSDKREKLNLALLRLACDNPGQTVAQIVDTIFHQPVPEGENPPSRDTIRRRIYRLGALGYLSLRQEIVVWPTEKAKKFVGHVEAQRSEEVGPHHAD